MITIFNCAWFFRVAPDRWRFTGISSLVLILWSWLLASEGLFAAEKIQVTVSILPQAYFVERIGGDSVKVNVMVGPGQSPHTYEPSPRQISDLAQSKIYFTIGMPFERVLLKKMAGIRDLTYIDTNTGIKLRHFAENEIDPHDNHPGDPDPHTWLNPPNAAMQAKTICDALMQLTSDTMLQGIFERNLSAFQNELDKLDKRLSAALEPFRGREFYVYHPAFGYFADSYGLKQVPIEIDGKEPSARQIASLIEMAKRDSIKIIFVQPEISSKGAEAIADAIDGIVIPLDNLAKDYLENLNDIAAKLEHSFNRDKR